MRKSYQPPIPPFALRLIAVALAFATMGLLVVLPAEIATTAVTAPDGIRQAAASTRSPRRGRSLRSPGNPAVPGRRQR